MILAGLLCILHLAAAEVPWWRSSVLYQIYPRSFADSDGDGSGDIRGIIQHLDYLKDIGVDVIWLSPIFKSPWKDMGYDISDYRDINSLYGSMKDVEELIKEVHNHGMRILLDFVPNHTSEEHVWFNASKNRLDGKDEFYVWKNPTGWDGSKPRPPNNWLSIFGGSAWTYHEGRKQYYLHQFGTYQPDLNYRNKEVILAMEENMRFWLDKGLDGFRVDAVPYLVEDEQLRDEPVIPNCFSNIKSFCMNHIYTQNVDGTYDVLKVIDESLSQYDNTTPKYLFLEGYATLEQTIRYYQKRTSPFNFELIIKVHKETNATVVKQTIDTYMSQLGDNWPNWVIGNHDNSRIGSKMGREMIDVMNMLVLMLPGACNTYQGEEIGMTDTFIPAEYAVDTTGHGRDPERTPVQWNREKNAGFSNATKTWLPVNYNYYTVNVENELKKEFSHLKTYKRLAEVRRNFLDSKDIETTTLSEWVFAFKRYSNKKEYYVIINLNNIEEEVVLKDGFKKIPGKLYIHTPSINAGFKIGQEVRTDAKITLMPRSAIGLSSASSIGLKFSLGLLVFTLWTFIFRE